MPNSRDKIGFDDHAIPSKGKVAWLIKVEQKKIGSQWKIDNISTMTINKEFIVNLASNETMRFFRNIGGSEKRTLNFTPYGLLPTEVISTNPGKTSRSVYEIYYGDRGQSYQYRLAKWKAQHAKEKAMKPRKKTPAPFGL